MRPVKCNCLPVTSPVGRRARALVRASALNFDEPRRVRCGRRCPTRATCPRCSCICSARWHQDSSLPLYRHASAWNSFSPSTKNSPPRCCPSRPKPKAAGHPAMAGPLQHRARANSGHRVCRGKLRFLVKSKQTELRQFIQQVFLC